LALIQCPECKREISDQALACPHCGAPRASSPQAPREQSVPRATPNRRPILMVILAAVLVVAAYLVSRPTLQKAGVVASARFAVDNAGGDEQCTVLGDYCMRVRCAVTNIGETSGVARVAADFLEDDTLVATHRGTTELLEPGQHDTLTLNFPEATMASTQHQYRCNQAQ
jgi:hypothetical protein